jgi:(2R)-3-sulfolactate dehydrogenase (NADP+)
MAEILASAMTGSVLSRDVKPLKTPHGPPHDLGQFYILIDPGVSDAFAARLRALTENIAQDPGARMPGQSRKLAETVEVVPDVWARLEELARGSRPSG